MILVKEKPTGFKSQSGLWLGLCPILWVQVPVWTLAGLESQGLGASLNPRYSFKVTVWVSETHVSCVVSKVHPGGWLGFSLSVLQPERTSSSSSSTLGTVTISSRHTLSSLGSQASSSHTHSPSLCLSWSLSPSLSLPLSSSLLLFFFLPTLLSHSNSLSSPPLPPSLLVSLDSGAQRTGFSLTPKQQEKQNKTKQQKPKSKPWLHGRSCSELLKLLSSNSFRKWDLYGVAQFSRFVHMGVGIKTQGLSLVPGLSV